MDLGPHAAFIVTAYGATFLIVALLIGWLLFDGARQAAALADLEKRGIRRRSAGKA
jgi:heme exporter protein D